MFLAAAAAVLNQRSTQGAVDHSRYRMPKASA
jgi:hypothetical protein